VQQQNTTRKIIKINEKTDLKGKKKRKKETLKLLVYF
jgi:hypothetical protein